eukprot:SAG11_NODE_2575_length_3206_cov_1.588993_4_plen_70_part_00
MVGASHHAKHVDVVADYRNLARAIATDDVFVVQRHVQPRWYVGCYKNQLGQESQAQHVALPLQVQAATT